jgi:plastocyanin
LDFRERGERLKGKPGLWRTLSAAAAAMLIGGASVLVGYDGRVDAAPDTTFVYAGSGSQGIAIQLFLPDSVAVNQGDTVEFINPYEEPHTVTYGEHEGPEDAPSNVEAAESFDGSEDFSSGFLVKDDHFSVTFAERGIFYFRCLLHPGMEMRVTVVREDDYIPPMGGNSPAVIRNIERGLALGEAASADALAAVKAGNASATDTWVVETGPSIPYKTATIDVMRFLEPEVNIPTGGAVLWRNDTFVPHMVTFFNGPPPADFNPFVPVIPASDVYSPSAFYNAVISANPAFGGVKEFSLTFNTPGSYSYVCVIHVDQGMAGVVHVGGAGITPPSTGDGGLLDRSSGSWMMAAGLALLLASFAGTAVMVRRRA